MFFLFADRHGHRWRNQLAHSNFDLGSGKRALKGGTATNLFVRDMPRLSVDIDLTYVPVGPREASLKGKGIDAGMRRLGDAISRNLRGARVAPRVLKPENITPKLDVELEGARMKIEVTPVSRGCVRTRHNELFWDGRSIRTGGVNADLLQSAIV